LSAHMPRSFITISLTICMLVYSTAQRALHSSPTRRSSDLAERPRASRERNAQLGARGAGRCPRCRRSKSRRTRDTRGAGECRERSEEHTSELQSPYDLVCRLLLEKKKGRRC